MIPGIPEFARVKAMGIPYQGKVTNGVFSTPTDGDLSIPTPGTVGWLLERPVSTPNQSTGLDAVKGWNWNERYLFDPATIDRSPCTVYIDGNDKAWLIQWIFTELSTTQLQVTARVYKRFGVFEPTLPTALDVDSSVTITVTLIQGVYSINAPDTVNGISQNPRGNRVLINAKMTSTGSPVSDPATEFIMEDDGYQVRRLGGIYEIELSGNIADNGTGLSLSYSTYKTMAECSGIGTITENNTDGSWEWQVTQSCASNSATSVTYSTSTSPNSDIDDHQSKITEHTVIYNGFFDEDGNKHYFDCHYYYNEDSTLNWGYSNDAGNTRSISPTPCGGGDCCLETTVFGSEVKTYSSTDQQNKKYQVRLDGVTLYEWEDDYSYSDSGSHTVTGSDTQIARYDPYCEALNCQYTSQSYNIDPFTGGWYALVTGDPSYSSTGWVRTYKINGVTISGATGVANKNPTLKSDRIIKSSLGPTGVTDNRAKGYYTYNDEVTNNTDGIVAYNPRDGKLYTDSTVPIGFI